MIQVLGRMKRISDNGELFVECHEVKKNVYIYA